MGTYRSESYIRKRVGYCVGSVDEFENDLRLIAEKSNLYSIAIITLSGENEIDTRGELLVSMFF